MKIAFIGGGNMGEAIVAAMLVRHLVAPDDITVSDASEARRELLKQRHKIRVTAGNLEAAEGAGVVLLAVKPQVLAEVTGDLAGKLKKTQLVISIMAGTTIATLHRRLDHERIVRSMPNTPAQIGEGMTVWTATEAVTARQKNTARNILGVMGKEIYVADERQIDMATAVSGSGPAYFFLFVESMIEAAVNIGLPRDQARTMVLQTMLGSALLLEKSAAEPAKLREMVTSKGGTTAEALGVFEEWQCRTMVSKAVAAAYRRAQELGGVKPA